MPAEPIFMKVSLSLNVPGLTTIPWPPAKLASTRLMPTLENTA